MRLRRPIGLCFVLLVLGCDGESPPVPVDAGPGTRIDAGTDAGPGMSTLAPTALPTLTPCPMGWRTVDVDGIEACEPWPESGRVVCPLGEMHLPGTPGCVRVDRPCDVDGFATDLPASPAPVFVRAGATGGDGSRGAPLGTLDEGLAAAGPDGVVALGAGTYAGTTVLDPVTLIGGCRDTVIDGDLFVIADARVENLRVTGTGVSTRDAAVILRRLIFTGDATDGLRVRGGSTVLQGCSLRGGDRGVTAARGGTVQIRGTEIAGTTNTALSATAGGVIEVEDSVIADAASGPSFLGFVLDGGELRMERSVIEDEHQSGVSGFGDARIELRDVVFRGPPASVDAEGPGLLLTDDSALVLQRVRVTRARTIAVAVAVGGTLAAQDVLVTDVLPRTGGLTGHGVEMAAGVVATLERVAVVRGLSVGVLVSDATTLAELRDVTITATQPTPLGTFGRGLQMQLGAMVTGTRVSVSEAHEVGVACSVGAVATLEDLRVDRTLERACAPSCDPAGIGVGAYDGSRLTLERFSITRHALVGVQLATDAELDLRDGEVAENPVGANVQILDYRVDRLTDRVLYRDNGVNLQSERLELPPATPPTSTP